jgi:hypothetical protein
MKLAVQLAIGRDQELGRDRGHGRRRHEGLGPQKRCIGGGCGIVRRFMGKSSGDANERRISGIDKTRETVCPVAVAGRALMKLGFNLLLWTPHVTLAHEPILRALKKTGYDAVEIPMFEGDPDHYARLGELLDKIGLERSVVSVMGLRARTRSPPTRRTRRPHSIMRNGPSTAVPHWGRRSWAARCIRSWASSPAAPQRRRSGSAALSFHKRAGDHAGRKGVHLRAGGAEPFRMLFPEYDAAAQRLSRRGGPSPCAGHV